MAPAAPPAVESDELEHQSPSAVAPQLGPDAKPSVREILEDIIIDDATQDDAEHSQEAETIVESTSRGRSGSYRPGQIRLIMCILLSSIIAAEWWVISQPSVPWLLDKVYFMLAFGFQILMGVSVFWVDAPRTIGSRLMDCTHWAFVVMLFSSVIILRAWQSLLLVVVLTLVSIIARLAMRNMCIITAAARHSSLPNISGRRVTVVFSVLFCIATLRLMLVVSYGRGFPFDQLLTKIGALSKSVKAAHISGVSAVQALHRSAKTIAF